MALQGQSIREQRHEQIYPTLDPLEIERVRRFGNLRSFAAGESLWTVGRVASGLMVMPGAGGQRLDKIQARV